MSDWEIKLEFKDGSSQKFWRGRTQGTEYIVNYGRIGTDGQTKAKDMGSEEKAASELEKVANKKRKKGYEDIIGGSEEPAVEVVTEAKIEDQKAKFELKRGNSTVVVKVETEGATIETEVEEKLDNPEAAALAFTKLEESLVAAGYRRVK